MIQDEFQTDLIIVVDTSGSMGGAPKAGQGSKMDILKGVLKPLLNSCGSGVHVLVVDMVPNRSSGSVQPLMPWTDMGRDKGKIVSMVHELRAAGDEDPENALRVLCESVKTRPLYRNEQRVFTTAIVLSDGQSVMVWHCQLSCLLCLDSVARI